MCPSAKTDGHDAPRLIDERVPSEAAVIDDIVVGFADGIGGPVVANEPPDILDWGLCWAFRRQWQHVILAGTLSAAEACHPARSKTSTAFVPRATWKAISARRMPIAWLLQDDSSRAIAFNGAESAESKGRGGALVLGR